MNHKKLEQERIKFIVERDGLEKALAWAAQTFEIYKDALVGDGKSHLKLPHYRPGVVDSLRVLRRFVRENKTGA